MFPFNWIVCGEIVRSTAVFPDYDSIYIHYFKSIFPFNCSISRIYFHSIVGFPDNFPFNCTVSENLLFNCTVSRDFSIQLHCFQSMFPFIFSESVVYFHSTALFTECISIWLHYFYFHLPAVYPE